MIRHINLGRVQGSLIIYPDSFFRSLIDGVSFFLLLAISLYIPFVISFDVDTTGTFDYIEIFIDTWFFFEIISNFFTGFFDKGRLVFNLRTICLTYLKGWFIIDAFASSPMIVIRILDSQATSS